jgi:hypothetical protein
VSSGRWKRSGEGANGRKERVPEGVPGLYSEEVGVVYGAPRRKRLAVAGGALGRHCALGAGVCSVSSVAAWFGRNMGGFSQDTIGFRLGPVAAEHHDARWGWQHVDVTMPCRRACSARLGGVQVLGNAQHALRVLGIMVASGWHGQGAVCGGSEVAASCGIGRGRAGKLDGEVTGREVVGAALPVLGAHDGYGDDQGRRGVAGAWSLQGGARVWVLVGWRSGTGGRGWRLVEGEGERRGFCRAVPRAPPPSSIQTENDKGKGVFGDLLNPVKILAGPFPPLGWFAKEK